MTHPSEPSAAASKRTSRLPRWVPRPWWLRILIVVLLLLVVLVLLVPAIASSSMVRGRVVAVLDARFRGGFAIDALQMSWFGPCEVRGFRVTDVEGREVLNASRARLDAGLWGLMTDWKSLGRVDVDATHVELIVRPDGTVSLFEALTPVTPSEEPLPELVADFHLRGASVTVTNAAGRTYRVDSLDADVTVDRLNRIAAETTLRLAAGGALAAKVELDQLLRDGQFSLDDMQVRHASVEVTEPVELGPVHAFLTGRPDLTGSVRRLKLEGDPAKGMLDVELTDLHDARFDPQKVQPVSAQVNGHYAVDRNLAADLALQLRGKPEKLELSFTWPLREGVLDFELPDLRKAVFEGSGVALPDFRLSASGSVDLAELGKVFPQVFRQVGGDRIGGNPLRLRDVVVTGGREPVASGQVLLGTDADDAKAGVLQTVRLDFNAHIEPGRGLKVDRASLAGRDFSVDASGRLDDFTATFDARDLAKLREQLGQVFELGWLTLAGAADGRLTAKAEGDDTLRYAVQAKADGFRLDDTRGGTRIAAPSASVDAKGAVRHAAWVPEVVTADETTTVVVNGLVFDRGEKLHVSAGTARFAGPCSVRLGKSGPERIDADGVSLTGSDLAFRGDDLSLAVGSAAFRKQTFRVAFADGDLARIDLPGGDVRVTGFAFRQADRRRLDLAAAGFKGDAVVAFDQGTPAKLQVSKATVDADDRLLVDCDGWLDLNTFALHATADVKKASLGHVFGKVVQLTGPVPQLTRWNGTVSAASSSVDWGGGDADFVFTSGRATVLAPQLDGTPLGAASVTAAWDEVLLPRRFDALRTKGVDVTGDLVTAKTERFNVSWGDPFTVDGKARVSGRLEKVLPAVGRFLKKEKLPALAGQATYDADFTAGAKLITFTGLGTLANAVVPAGETRRTIAKADFSQTGSIELADGKLAKVHLTTNTFNVPGMLVGTATGTFSPGGASPADAAFEAKLDVTETDLAVVGDWLAAFGLPQLKRYAGPATVTADVRRAAPGAPFTSAAGKATLTRPLIDGTPVTGHDVVVDWKNARYDVAKRSFAVEWLKVNAGPAGAASAANASGDLGDKPRLAGELNVLADLPTALPAIGRITKTADLPKVKSGRLAWNPVVVSDGVTTRLSNKPGTQGMLTDLVIGEGTKTFTDKRVVFDLSVDVNPSQEAAAVNRLTVDSTHLWFTCTGTVTSYRTVRHLHAVQGNYRATWNRLMPLVYQFAPTLERQLKLSGDTAGTFTLAGTLNHPTAKPPYQHLTGKAQAGWTSAVIYGLPLGKATFAPELKDGLVVLPPTQVDAGQNAEGKINLAGVLDLRTDPPTLHVVKSRPVENLHLTREFTWPELSEFFPFFGNLGGVTGIVSVDLQSLRYPLSQAGLGQMTGRGTVELDKFRFRPKGLFGILGKVIGLMQIGSNEEQEMPKTLAPFEVRDGRVYYENVVLWIGKDQDMVFSGWVGFDDRIDMKVSMPGKLLGKDVGTRMVLRITGTRQVPIINPLGTLLPGDSGKDILKGLGDLLGPRKEEPKPAP